MSIQIFWWPESSLEIIDIRDHLFIVYNKKIFKYEINFNKISSSGEDNVGSASARLGGVRALVIKNFFKMKN